MKAVVRSSFGTLILFCIFCVASSFVPVEVPVTNNLRAVASAAPVAITPPAVKKATGINGKVKALQQRLKSGSTGLIILVILGALLTTLLFAFGLYILAFGGVSEAIIALVAVVGLGLIIWGTVSIIKGIIRNRGLARARFYFKKRPAVTRTKKDTPAPLSF